MKSSYKLSSRIPSAIIGGAVMALMAIAGCQSSRPFGMRIAPAHRALGSPGPAKLVNVNLFPNGLGMFTFQGEVHGSASQTLEFRSAEIDDVLASIVFDQTGNGQIGEITYPVDIPLTEQLQHFPIDISGAPSRAMILSQLRGVRVTLRLARPVGGAVTGRILDLRTGTSKREGHSGGKSLVVRLHRMRSTGNRGASSIRVNLISRGALLHVKLSQIKTVIIHNAALRRSLAKALNLLEKQKQRHLHPLTLWYRGRGSREVGFAYLMETPIWRVTYRVVLPPPNATHKSVEVQAMASVTNQSNCDWKHVRLDLRGGEPLSFISRLYHPLYQHRPVQPLNPSLYREPQTWTGHIRSSRLLNRRYRPVPVLPRGTANMGGVGPGNIGGGGSIFQENSQSNQAGEAPMQPPFNPLEGVGAMAQASDVYPEFDYHVSDLTLARGDSALVPILVSPLAARLADYYSMASTSVHPMLGIRIDNNTSHYLPPGSASVYRGAVFAGQTLLPALPPGGHRTVKFAIDRSITVTFGPIHSPPSRLADASIRLGGLTLHYVGRNLCQVKLNNSGIHPRTVFLSTVYTRRSFLAPRSLLTKRQSGPLGTLRIMAAPHRQKLIHIRIRTTSNEDFPVVNLDALQLHSLLRQFPQLPKSVMADVRHGRVLAVAVAKAQSLVAHTKSEINATGAIALKFQQSLSSLKKVSPAYNKLAALLINENLRYAALTKQLAHEQSAEDAAAHAVTRFWRHVRIKKTPVALH